MKWYFFTLLIGYGFRFQRVRPYTRHALWNLDWNWLSIQFVACMVAVPLMPSRW